MRRRLRVARASDREPDSEYELAGGERQDHDHDEDDEEDEEQELGALAGAPRQTGIAERAGD